MRFLCERVDLASDLGVGLQLQFLGLEVMVGLGLLESRLRVLADHHEGREEYRLKRHHPRFCELWARADVGYRGGIIHMRHPLVGDLHLQRNRLNVPHSGGQHLLIYHAKPGSESSRALEKLRALSI